jgi:hypothetical protein
MGNKIKISIINKKNTSRKIVEYFNEKDQRIAQKDYDFKSGLLQRYIEYLPGSGWAALKMIWYNKGKEKYRTENTYNENGRCTGWVSYKNGKMSGRGINSYNLKGDIEKSEQFNKRNKRTPATDYAYEYY